jgi:hypothetical protein
VPPPSRTPERRRSTSPKLRSGEVTEITQSFGLGWANGWAVGPKTVPTRFGPGRVTLWAGINRIKIARNTAITDVESATLSGSRDRTDH